MDVQGKDPFGGVRFGALRTPVAVGLLVLALVILGVVGYSIWGAFTSPGVVVEQPAEEDDAVATEETIAEPSWIYVHVTGLVASPGMYRLEQGARVQDAITAAGGFVEGASDASVNLARELADGEQVVVGTQEAAATTGTAADASTGTASGKVNLNTATSDELCSLSGVGQATAAKIIAYRETNGPFATIEDIKNVSGIGDKKFEAIKDAITV